MSTMTPKTHSTNDEAKDNVINPYTKLKLEIEQFMKDNPGSILFAPTPKNGEHWSFKIFKKEMTK